MREEGRRKEGFQKELGERQKKKESGERPMEVFSRDQKPVTTPILTTSLAYAVKCSHMLSQMFLELSNYVLLAMVNGVVTSSVAGQHPRRATPLVLSSPREPLSLRKTARNNRKK